MRWRRALIVVACMVAAAAIGARIWWVNANAYRIPVEKYSMGEWVSYDGCFLETIDEDNEGYSVRIDSAEVMSEAEYHERYAVNDTYTEELSDEQSLMALTLTIKNEGNEPTEYPAINLIAFRLVTTDNIDILYPLMELWASSEASLASAEYYPLMISIPADTEKTITMPFTLSRDVNLDRRDIAYSSFYYYVTRGPIQKLVEVTL